MQPIRRVRASFKAGFILPLLLVGVASHTSILWAESPGTFTATGSMTTARMWHTATLLPSGKVLITGGYGPGASELTRSSATAELYDPVTGNFTATGDMTTRRVFHTATLLPNGKVLIAGGVGCRVAAPCDFNALHPPGVEFYDPSTGTFTAADNITTDGQTATLLTDGRVLITRQPTAVLYDPATNKFSATGTYASAMYAGTATLLPEGTVLMVGGGGWDAEGSELYDPHTGTFSLTGNRSERPIQFRRLINFPAALLANGQVLFAGGDNAGDDGVLDSAEIYDPSTGTFSATGVMTAPRNCHTGTFLPDGTVLIAGGTGPVPTAELYHPATGTFSPIGNMTTPRFHHTATLLNDGRVLIAGGGLDQYGGNLASAELYSPPSLVPAPVLFSPSPDGRGQGAILHPGTSQLASSSTPAVVGEALEVYLTGLIDGSQIPPQVAIGGRMAEILYFGKAPGFADLNQVNVRVPNGITPGPAVPVRLIYLGRSSNEVTIGVR
jgi:Galactose oxidase, central domain/Kelch motif